MPVAAGGWRQRPEGGSTAACADPLGEDPQLYRTYNGRRRSTIKCNYLHTHGPILMVFRYYEHKI